MKTLTPVVLLLTTTCLACLVLLFQDRDENIRQSLEVHDPDTALTEATTQETGTVSVPLSLTEPLSLIEPPGLTEPNNLPESQTDQESAAGPSREIAFRIIGLQRKSAKVFVAVFDSGVGFPKSENSFHTTVVTASGNEVEVALTLEEKRPVAVAVFQDVNGDGVLTKNGFGIPIEPYGFSNNARSLLGPPAFSEAILIVDEATVDQEIRVR
jgi:uncharacterized protein (DUF2141 family)